MATIQIRAMTGNKSLLTNDIVGFGARDERVGFKVNPEGTLTGDTNVIDTEIGDMDSTTLIAAILAKVGVTYEQNPAYADVYTDDGANDDDTADDGVNDGTRYNWAYSGQLYEVVPAAEA